MIFFLYVYPFNASNIVQFCLKKTQKTFDHNSKKGLTRDDVVHQCCGHAKDANQQVTDGQVENEEIGDCTHVLAP